MEIEGLIGFFINMLPLRTDLSGNPTFLEILARVREVALGAYAHQDLPFDKLVEELQPERDSGAAPFFRVAFGFQNAPMDDLVLPALRFTAIPVESEAARFDLTIWAWEQDGNLGFQWTYDTDRFDAAAIERLHGSFAALLESAYRREKPDAGRLELESIRQFALQAPALVVALSAPVEGSKIPAWEQQLSAGAAIMNLLHASHALGFAAGWLTGWPAYNEDVRQAFAVGAERLAGLIFIGTPGRPQEERPRPAYEQIVSIWDK